MILYFENSYGIGNTIIELSVLCTLNPHKKIIFFTSSKQILPIQNSSIITVRYERNFLNRILKTIFKKLFLYLSNLRLISLIYEEFRINKKKICLRKGLISFISLVAYSNHFQIPEYLDNLDLILSSKFCDDLIKKELKNKKYTKINWNNACFIHIRRGDYMYWPNARHPAILNLSWYKKAIDIIKQKNNITQFIICSNDIFFVKDIFETEKDFVIFHKNPFTDLCMMSKCRYGILSASSFSWLAAKISRSRFKNNQIFLAPRYWAGHRFKKWYPYKFKFDWIEYI